MVWLPWILWQEKAFRSYPKGLLHHVSLISLLVPFGYLAIRIIRASIQMEKKLFLDNKEANDLLVFLSLPWLLIVFWSQNDETHLHITCLREQGDATDCTAAQSYHKSKQQSCPALLGKSEVILSCQCPPDLQAGLGSYLKVFRQPPSQNLKDECKTFLGFTAGIFKWSSVWHCHTGVQQPAVGLALPCSGQCWDVKLDLLGSREVPLQATVAQLLLTVREEEII